MEGRTHKPVVNEEKCGPCGVCRGMCPSLVLGDLAAENDTVRGILSSAVTGRPKDGIPPCRDACPLGQDIQGYLACLAEGDQTGALKVILQDNPLPAVLGHVCHHPCEQSCVSSRVQDPPSIRELKRYAALAPRPEVTVPPGPAIARAAIIGSGPAGLTAAWTLALNKVAVTIFEAESVAGGMLAWAIPPFRLPRRALEQDLNYVLAHGIDLRLNTPLLPGSLRNLRGEYDAVILACGARRSRVSDLQGGDLHGMWPGLDFLKQAALGPEPQLRRPVVVVGGGNVAVDAARWALRLASDVTLIYRRDREQMPAYAEEVDAAIAEGLKIAFRTQPVSIKADDHDHVAGIVVARTTPSETPRGERVVFTPTGEQTTIPARTIILALGQETEAPAWAAAADMDGITPDRDGRLASGLYGAGDLVTGPSTVVEAMAAGAICAQAILREVAK